MNKSPSNNIRSLEEIMQEISASEEKNDTSCSPLAFSQVLQVTEELARKSHKVHSLCTAEPDVITENPQLLQGAYLRQDFTERLSAALLEMEEILFSHGTISTYDTFEVSRYLSAHKNCQYEPVSIHIEKSRILIRMPYLPKRYGGAKDLCNQMLAAKIYHTENFPKWPKWKAKYYHVFPTATADIPKDVDNYEYKRTNDILGFALGTCDNALRFSMSMTTVFTDKLAPGTYIEVTQKSSENIDFLKEAFAV